MLFVHRTEDSAGGRTIFAWPVVLLVFCLERASSVGDAAAAEGEPFTLTILHINDLHSHFDPTDPYGGRCRPGMEAKCVGGAARQLYLTRELRQKYPASLLLNAGDNFQGTPWYSVFKSRVVTEVTELMNYDALCLGNHEFDDGPSGLQPFVTRLKSSTSVLASNVDFSSEPGLQASVNKSVILTVAGHRIGVIGAVTPDTTDLSSPGNVTFSDDIVAIRTEADALKKEGVKIIIALTHVGYDRDQQIAKEVPAVDVVVGGHSHSFLYTGDSHPKEDTPKGPYPTIVTRKDGTKALVVQAYCYGKYLGFLNVTFNEAGNVAAWSGNPILLENSIPEDEDMQKLLSKYEQYVMAATRAPVGASRVLLNADDGACRRGECNIGNLLADSFFEHYLDKDTGSSRIWSVINGVLINGGSIRTSIGRSDRVIMEDVMIALPFGNRITLVNLTGAHLYRLFEHGVERYNPLEPSGSFPQVSGFRVHYDVTRPRMQRVVSLKVLCTHCIVPALEKVDASKYYSIATLEYAAKGGDGYNFTGAHIGEYGEKDIDVFVKHFRKLSPVAPTLEERIVFVQSPQAQIQPASTGHGTTTTAISSIVIAALSLLLIT